MVGNQGQDRSHRIGGQVFPKERGALHASSPQPSPPFLAQKAAGQLSWQLGTEGKDAMKSGVPRMEREQREAENPPVPWAVR